MRSEHRLTLAALEEFDPRAPARGTERRFCCPICGREKRVDAAHRHLSANLKTGAWNCHCCDGRGKLQEFWTEREAAPIRRRRPIPRAFVLRPEPTREPEPEPKQVADLAEKLAGCRDLLGSRGEQYLLSRELNPSLAAAADVQFHPAWDGRAAVVFPLIDRAGATVAAEARFLHVPEGRRKSGCRGPKSSGAFVTPGALGADLVALVEGPACALTLAALGLPAIAVMGRELPDWLRLAMARRRVLIASDADAAGDTAAEEWGAALRAFGARVERFRPEGEKDWNDLLREDPEGLARQLEALGLAVPVPSSETPPAPVAGEDDDPFLLLEEDPDAPPLCGRTRGGIPVTLRALLAAAEEAGVTLAVEADRLRMECPPGVDAALLAALRERKGEILGWLTRDRGWFRLESRLLGEVVLIACDAEAPIPEEFAGLARYTLAEAARFRGDPEGLARYHRERRAAADRELLTDEKLRAEVGHIFAGVSLEAEPSPQASGIAP